MAACWCATGPLELFAEQGFEATSTWAVAAAAGLSSALV
ncbi:TetR family transcriptional regulator [Streptomyces sp. UG1]